MQNLKRNIALTFRVSAEEREMIERRMAQTSIRNLRAYLLKMAVDGRIIEIDLTHVRECSRLLGNIANNVNQMAKRANETGNIYAADIADIQERITDFREQQNKTIKILSDLLEAV